MTTFLFVMGFLVLAVAGLGLGLWLMIQVRRLGRQAAPAELTKAAPLRSYGPMVRLFDGRDLQFLQSQLGCQPGMTTRLRLERRAVLSLYLRQAHADFRRSWACWREVAPWTESPEIAPAMVKQFLAFYGLYTALRLHCLLGSFVYVRTDVGSLLVTLQRLRQRVRQTVGQSPTNLPTATTR